MKTCYKIMALVVAAILISHSASFAQATYYFSATGDDGNNGTSSSTPKKSLDTALLYMNSGNIIKFKRGDKWYNTYKTWNIVSKNNFTLDAYGTGAKPVIGNMIYIDSTQFSAVPGYTNVFKYTDPQNVRDYRVIVNGVSRIALRDKYANTSSLYHLDSTDEFRFDTSTRTLYLKMPSAARPHNVEVVGAINGATSGVNTVKFQDVQNATIKNIEFRGGAKYSCVYVHAPCYNITFDSCIVSRTSYKAGGMTATNSAKNMNVVRKLIVKNCILDKAWTKAENNIKHQDDMKLGGDGISFMHAVDSSVIKDCFITNWGHSAIQLSTTLDSFGIFGVKNNKVEHNDVGSGNSAYMHAFDISGFKNMTSKNIIKRNYFHNFNSACNFAGNNNFIFSNIFDSVTVSPIPQHSHQPHGGQLFPWHHGESGKDMDGRDNWIAHNTFYKMQGYGLYIGQSTGDTNSVKGNKVINNIFMNYGEDTTYALDDNKPGHHFSVALRILTWKPNAGHNDGIPKGDLVLRNNNFYFKDSADTKRIARIDGNSYTAASIDGCPEGGSRFSGNTWFNPRFDSWWGLTAESPEELRQGGVVYTMTNYGLPAGEFVDYYGVPWPTSNPSVGAVQYLED